MSRPQITGFTAAEITAMREHVSAELADKIHRACSAGPRRTATKGSAEDQVESLVLDDTLREYARKYGHDPEEVLENWRSSKRSNGYKVGKNLIANAREAFMYWIRNSEPKPREMTMDERAALEAKKFYKRNRW